MSSGDLNLFSHLVLGLVGRGGASPYELQRMARQGRIYDWAGESQYHVARRLPHRERYLMMGHRLSRRLLAVHLEWLDEIERELES